MKIILRDEKELLELKEACRHIHNSNVDMNIPMVNLISHLYLSEKDAPGLKDILIVEHRKTLDDIVEEMNKK